MFKPSRADLRSNRVDNPGDLPLSEGPGGKHLCPTLWKTLGGSVANLIVSFLAIFLVLCLVDFRDITRHFQAAPYRRLDATSQRNNFQPSSSNVDLSSTSHSPTWRAARNLDDNAALVSTLVKHLSSKSRHKTITISDEPSDSLGSASSPQPGDLLSSKSLDLPSYPSTPVFQEASSPIELSSTKAREGIRSPPASPSPPLASPPSVAPHAPLVGTSSTPSAFSPSPEGKVLSSPPASPSSPVVTSAQEALPGSSSQLEQEGWVFVDALSRSPPSPPKSAIEASTTPPPIPPAPALEASTTPPPIPRALTVGASTTPPPIPPRPDINSTLIEDVLPESSSSRASFQKVGQPRNFSRHGENGGYDPLYQSLGMVQPFFGDLADAGATDTLLQLRSFQNEIIGLYTNSKFAGMAVNLIMNLKDLGFYHYILFTNDKKECDSIMEQANGNVDSCAWQSAPEDSTDPYYRPPGNNQLGNRHYWIWQFLRRGVSTLWMDTDVYITRNFYPYMKGELKDVNLILKPFRATRAEFNTGIMYAQNVSEDGPVVGVFKWASDFWHASQKLVIEEKGKIVNRNGKNVGGSCSMEQPVFTDAVENFMLSCRESHRVAYDDVNEGDPEAFEILRKAMTEDGRVTIGCPDKRKEVLKSAAMQEFGWKEDAYDAYAAAYKAHHEGENDIADIIEERMPLIVHVRDTRGGYSWEKDWRMAQLGWWHDSIDNVADWGIAHEAVGLEGKGKLLWLQNFQPNTFEKPVDLLNGLEMFVKVALLLERVPVLPEFPCELTLREDWPAGCPDIKDTPRWYIINVDQSETDPTFRCTINDRACESTCLRTRWLTANLEPYFTSGATFKSHFPTAPVEVDVSTLAKKRVTASQLKAAFAMVAEEVQVAMSAAHLPHSVTELNEDSDQRKLWSCTSRLAAEALTECTFRGKEVGGSKSNEKCRALDEPDSSVRKSFNSTKRVEQIVWEEYDLTFNQRQQQDKKRER